jgi:HEAT repeat protein
MFAKITRLACLFALSVAAAGVSAAQETTPAKKDGAPAKSKRQAPAPSEEPRRSESELLGVLKSDDATRKDKADACRLLSLVGTAKSVPVLADLLGDEAMAHMARYALEPIPDPAVDTALREALGGGKIKGRLLVGVIGSVGVRRDVKAVDALAALLKDADPQVVRASAKALGRIGTNESVKALEAGLAEATPAQWPGYYEGLFRGADALAARGRTADALAIYARLSQPEAPPQVRDGAARKARLLSQEQGKGL